MKLAIKKEKNKLNDFLTGQDKNRHKINQKLTVTLGNSRKRLFIWLFDFALVILLTIAFGVFLGLFNRISSTSPIWLQNKFSFSVLHSLCISGLCFVYAPFLVYICLFLFGITNLHKSTPIQYLIWFFILVSLILFLAIGITYGVILMPWDDYYRSKIFK